jgi:phage-related protein
MLNTRRKPCRLPCGQAHPPVENDRRNKATLTGWPAAFDLVCSAPWFQHTAMAGEVKAFVFYIGMDIIMGMKPVEFLGDSLKCLRTFPENARHDAGFQLDAVQRGEEPADWKPMPVIGKGVSEIRIWDEGGTFRVIYTARLADAVYVLHAFQKKSEATEKRNVDLAKKRYDQLMARK